MAGSGSLTLELPEGSSVHSAKTALLERCPALLSLMPVMLIAVDGHYASDENILPSSCEIACFPPVSGG